MDEYLHRFVKNLKQRPEQIDINRKDDLNLLAELIHSEIEEKEINHIVFICTHNSRRSQLAELMLRIASQEFGFDQIHTYSGGIEVTAFNHRMVKALEREGLEFEKSDESSNPVYVLKSELFPQPMFSKIYDDDVNPSEDFIAVMVCDHADENCPVITGATERISLPYLDPKAFDDTPEEADAYSQKVSEIGSEMIYLCERLDAMS